MRILITGGAGFIGANVADRFARAGHRVTLLDNLSRRGAAANLKWLKARHPSVHFLKSDIRDASAIARAVKGTKPDVILHFAAQVAVTHSVTDPRHDFDTNALGAFNVLEAARLHAPKARLIYSSTNKVYGGLEHLKVVRRGDRYEWRDCAAGVSESQPLDFHSPYGCSKGAADAYFVDYARIYGLRTLVLRQSCIYGYRQFGVEDQGWVAWFLIAAELGRPITIFGDGRQVRDVLFMEDLADCYQKAVTALDRRPALAGRAFNIGGGPACTLSLRELLAMLGEITGRVPPVSHADPRPGDQKVYVSDIRAARRELGWKPRTTVARGVRLLHRWIRENRELLRRFLN